MPFAGHVFTAESHWIYKKGEKKDERTLYSWQLWCQPQQSIILGNQHALLLNLAASQLTRKSHRFGQGHKHGDWCALYPQPQLGPYGSAGNTSVWDTQRLQQSKNVHEKKYSGKIDHTFLIIIPIIIIAKLQRFKTLLSHPSQNSPFSSGGVGNSINSGRAHRESWSLKIKIPQRNKAPHPSTVPPKCNTYTPCAHLSYYFNCTAWRVRFTVITNVLS